MSRCLNQGFIVSPYIGEWIEIFAERSKVDNIFVSPYIGEWIEIEDKQEAISKFLRLTLHR